MVAAGSGSPAEQPVIDTLNPGFGGVAAAPVDDYVRNQKMTRFIFRSVVTARPVESARAGFAGQPVTPEQAATWTNAIQAMAESTRLGIPVLFKSNARNHYERDARFGINTEAGSFSEWPKEAGLAAARDLALIEDFARTMGQEWQAIGLRGMYGYTADLVTEPRWYRAHECLTEEADNLSFTAMAASKSWAIVPPLGDIKAVMDEVGAARTILCIYFRQPYVLDEESGLKDAGAVLAGFGVSDAALMDVITGRFAPRGKLPFALARTLKAVIENAPDAPGYPPADTLFPFGHGLTYARRGRRAVTDSRPAAVPRFRRRSRCRRTPAWQMPAPR